MKNWKFLFFYGVGILFYITNSIKIIFAAPKVNCVGLPGCPDTSLTNPTPAHIKHTFDQNIVGKVSVDLVSKFIQYIGVIAVISLMLGGIMYILSGGEDEKIKKAKSWIIWSLVGVFFSVSAWGIITFITKLTINN